jgi:hypothetical protein
MGSVPCVLEGERSSRRPCLTARLALRASCAAEQRADSPRVLHSSYKGVGEIVLCEWTVRFVILCVPVDSEGEHCGSRARVHHHGNHGEDAKSKYHGSTGWLSTECLENLPTTVIGYDATTVAPSSTSRRCCPVTIAEAIPRNAPAITRSKRTAASASDRRPRSFRITSNASLESLEPRAIRPSPGLSPPLYPGIFSGAGGPA